MVNKSPALVNVGILEHRINRLHNSLRFGQRGVGNRDLVQNDPIPDVVLFRTLGLITVSFDRYSMGYIGLCRLQCSQVDNFSLLAFLMRQRTFLTDLMACAIIGTGSYNLTPVAALF